jgi:hypothetical protein
VCRRRAREYAWIPACAGMTMRRVKAILDAVQEPHRHPGRSLALQGGDPGSRRTRVRTARDRPEPFLDSRLRGNDETSRGQRLRREAVACAVTVRTKARRVGSRGACAVVAHANTPGFRRAPE